MHENPQLYNTESLSAKFFADKEFIKHIISLFIEHMPKNAASLEAACEKSDWKAVYFYAHKMKSNIDLFNLDPLKQPIRNLEDKAKSLTGLQTICEEVQFITSYIKDCVQAMKEELKESV